MHQCMTLYLYRLCVAKGISWCGLFRILTANIMWEWVGVALFTITVVDCSGLQNG